MLAQDRPGQALALLDRLHAAAAAQDRTGSMIEAGALRALALAAGGQEADAVSTLAGVLTLACPQGQIRIFADEGSPMAALVRKLIAAQRSGQAAARVPLGCLARLQRAFDAEHTAPRTLAVPGLVEPLTSRELEVLERLAVNVSVRNWSDTTTFLVEAEVVHPMVSDLVRESYPVIFGQALNFSLPLLAEGPSIEAEINGDSIVFPLGPDLFLSWADCHVRVDKDQAKAFRCELKPGYRFK